jgi:hypothetical protein
MSTEEMKKIAESIKKATEEVKTAASTNTNKDPTINNNAIMAKFAGILKDLSPSLQAFAEDSSTSLRIMKRYQTPTVSNH